MSLKPLGVWIGLVLGVIFAIGGFGSVVFASLAALIGLVVEKVIAGEIDVSDYIGNRDN